MSGAMRIGVNTSVSKNEQVSNVYNEAQKYTDQSVKDTMIQNYITDITTRSEDVTELVKNFTNNVSAEVDSIQQNKTKFGACVDLDGANIVQSNELIQKVKQGFEKLNKDAKVLKKVIDSESKGEIQAGQGSENNQGASASTDQAAKIDQGSTQKHDQKAGFTALNAYNKIMVRERFGMQKLNSFANLVKKDKKKSIREHFDSWLYPREKFCFGCVDVNTAVSNSSQTSNATNIDLQTNIQTQDIYKKIDTAYDKTVETIIKISETLNETTNSIAAASSIQINEFIIETQEDACKLNLKNLTVDQKNKLEQNVELTTAIQNINSLTNDVEVKAIMTDMLGLTQASKTAQDSKTDTKQKSDQSQKNEQTATQTAGGGGSWVFIIIILIAVCVGFMVFKSSTSRDGYFDGSPSSKITRNNRQASINTKKINNPTANSTMRSFKQVKPKLRF